MLTEVNLKVVVLGIIIFSFLLFGGFYPDCLTIYACLLQSAKTAIKYYAVLQRDIPIHLEHHLFAPSHAPRCTR